MPHGRRPSGNRSESIISSALFLRRGARGIEFTTLTRHDDGSCGFWCAADDCSFTAHTFEFGADNDAAAFARLAELGFLPAADAVSLGWVPRDWKPPPTGLDFDEVARGEAFVLGDARGTDASEFDAHYRPSLDGALFTSSRGLAGRTVTLGTPRPSSTSSAGISTSPPWRRITCSAKRPRSSCITCSRLRGTTPGSGRWAGSSRTRNAMSE